MKVKLLELFGGIGAPRKALENIGIEVKSVDYVEILNNAVKAYNAMYDNSYTPQDVLEWNLNIDLLVHGSPCQDFSVVGLNDLSSGRSILYNRTLEIIKNELHPRPKYVLWENVTGLITKKHISHFYHYLNTMEEMGYKNYYGVINANEMGSPQARQRVFTISIRNDIDQSFDFEVLERHAIRPIKEYLVDFGNNCQLVTQPSMINSLFKHKTLIANTTLSTITTKQCRWNGSVIVNDKEFYEQDLSKFPSKSSCGYSIEEFFKYFPQYKDKPIETIFRYLTPKECWLLQGFDEATFERVNKIIKSNTSLYHLAGNSICVLVLESIFKELLIDKKSRLKEISLFDFKEE